MYTYNVQVERVVDGDTVDIFIDLGFKVWHKDRVRLNGIDTAEKNTPLGKATKEFLKTAIEGKTVKMVFYKPDKYGRYLADVYLTEKSTMSVNSQLVMANVAKSYYGDSKSDLWKPEELNLTTIGTLVLE